VILRPLPFDHPDAQAMIAAIQQEMVVRYGGPDETPVDPRQFDPPAGMFLVGYVEGVPVASGGWRARDAVAGDPQLAAGDAEIKRMYVEPAHRGRGYARAVLAEVERTAVAAGRVRMILETGTAQPEAMELYRSAGYAPMPGFGTYRGEPDSRCFSKIVSCVGRPVLPGR